ncbi:MAG TPA: shikimate dehydrogenase [Burkholderiales bacterium]|nr:shikimate dehydrogenase [Burkholderiales bacterium]
MVKPLLCGLIGAGIQGSRAPALQEGEARAQGLALEYRLIDLDVLGVGVEALPQLVERCVRDGFSGLNITYPCKQAVMPLLDALSEEARAIGAVNTVVISGGRKTGHNTDGPGWAWGFQRALPRADLTRVVLLGAGGAGAACADALLRLGAKELLVVDRDAGRAAELAARRGCTAETDLERALHGASGLVHATPTGMAKTPGLPLPAGLLRPDLWVSEVVYVPLETELLRAAKRAGCRVMDGGHMNVGQAALGFRLFTGREADTARMETLFRAL